MSNETTSLLFDNFRKNGILFSSEFGGSYSQKSHTFVLSLDLDIRPRLRLNM